MKRRSFLQGLVAAPVAAPVIARDAAEKAGLAKLGGFGASGAGIGSGNGGGWDVSWVKIVFSETFEDELRETMRVHRLDPDLACSRSLSLATAMRIQKEREVQRALKERRSDAARTYKRITGQEWPL